MQRLYPENGAPMHGSLNISIRKGQEFHNIEMDTSTRIIIEIESHNMH